ncbi:hypothetical protein SO802_029117 [Lithocarpus litseifolius]|uniref:Uncharacterized protein n=1 Tax=Lithocarpus litseifolius TaxID=425828 RepID=A0AAW2BU52_9ROSI
MRGRTGIGRRSNFSSNSKPQSHPHIPILNLKRKRDYRFLPDLLANAKPHLDGGSDLNENPKPHKIKRLKIIPPKNPPHSCSATLTIHDMEGHTNTVAPIWSSFDALVEVASVEIEKFDKFARLIKEKALKKPIFIHVKSVSVQKRPRFGDVDDQDWSLELETKKQRAMVGQEKVMGSAFSVQDWGLGLARQEILARLINPKLQIFNDIVLILWDIPKDTRNTSSTYALRTRWNIVQKSNDLKEGDLVQLSSFRVGQQACEDASSSSSASNKGHLCFALLLLQGDKIIS